MAKSKSGGTRSYLRGRVGADVYSVGRDAAGKKQQVVRSLAETVANPQTLAQMRGRMIMSTVMQAVSAMSPIIDHAFDNVPKGQPCISEFIKRNYALIKIDVAEHPASGNAFELNEYQEKGVKQGAYNIAAGAAVIPAGVLNAAGSKIEVQLTADTLTVGGLKAKMGVSGDYYYTLAQIGDDGVFRYVRIKFKANVADSTALTNDSLATIFDTEGNGLLLTFLNTNKVTLDLGDNQGTQSDNQAVILSQDSGEGWKHSDATLSVTGMTLNDPADEVLPTYPVGTEDFLNGGDI